MKTYLSFNDQSEDDREKLKDVLQATDMKIALQEIGDEVFRPARKHGYTAHPELNKLLNENDDVGIAIGLLEEMFYQILKDREVSLE